MIDAQTARQLLDYNPATGAFTWRWRPEADLKWNAKHAGKPAGSYSHGYTRINVGKRLYYAHRVAWLMLTGSWPDGQLDHINGDGTDNRLCNLRPCSQAENTQNLGPNKRNSTGFVGVTFSKRDGRWRAQIRANYKQFNLGSFNSPEDAALAYRVAKAKLHTFNPEVRA
jgi:hypothetical protein